MNSDWTEGFKAGFKIGLEEGKRNQNLNPVPQINWPERYSALKDKCPKCGITISGVMNYTCSSINCPTFYTATSSVGIPLTGAATYDLNNTWSGSVGPAGAVGSMSANYESSDVGANGPSGPNQPIDYSMR